MNILNYIFGPKLYMEYGTISQKLYEPTGLESFGDQILSTLSLTWNITFYTSPLLLTFLYRTGYFVSDYFVTLLKLSTSIGVILAIALCMRGWGRSQSSSYVRLVKVLELVKSQTSNEREKNEFRQFDFDFRYWEVNYDASNPESALSEKKDVVSFSSRRTRPFKLAMLPCKIIGYLAIHTFGIRMIYPGSVKLFQSYMRSMLISGRAKLIEEEKAKRFKVKTIEKNEIDTMFVDNRNKGGNGSTLVICSEGNAGFYEIGIMNTPLSRHYSVLGWNHPGFEGSSGSPYPDQDRNAIDAVVQFAILGLGFSVNEIILFGWSIGAYSTLWAASIYPDVKGVILDATFDDIIYLVETRMPSRLISIAKIAIREYCNLNNAEMIPNYNGPILLIRRTEDEIISEDNRIETNRGNFLVIFLLKYRYPNIFKEPQVQLIKNMLLKPVEVRMSNSILDEESVRRLVSYSNNQGKSFPMQIGEDYTENDRNQMAEFLFHKHLSDYKSSHCTSLPSDYFNVPWDIPTVDNFVR